MRMTYVSFMQFYGNVDMSMIRGICRHGGRKSVPERRNGNGATATSQFRQLDWDAGAKEQVWVRETCKSDGEWSRLPGIPRVEDGAKRGKN